MTIANAMKYSLNTTFDQLAYQAGPSNVAKTAHAMGIREDRRVRQSAARGQGTAHHLRHRHRRLPGQPDRPGRRVRHARQRRHRQRRLTSSRKATDSNGKVVYKHNVAGATRDRRARSPTTSRSRWSRSPPAPATRSPAAGCRRPRPAPRASPARPGQQRRMDGRLHPTGKRGGVGRQRQLHGPIVNAAGRPEYGADLPGKTWQLFMDTYLAGQPALPMATKQLITGRPERVDADPDADAPAPSTSSASTERHHVGADARQPPPPPRRRPSPGRITSHTPSPSCTSGVPNTCPPPGG